MELSILPSRLIRYEIYGYLQAASYQQEGNTLYVTGLSETYQMRLDII